MIKHSFIEIEKRFNKMSLRERIIIFCGFLMCVCWLTYFWMLEPAMLRQAQAEKILQFSYRQEEQINSDIAEMELLLQKDPLQEINSKIAFSMQILAGLDKQLDDKLVNFIHAQKMPLALSKVLSKSRGIEVSSLKTLPVKAVNSSIEKHSEEEKQPAENIFYKHTLEIQLTGDYNAIYQYFLNLEALQEKFYCKKLNYQVTDYPLARVTIEIYTLSDQQDLVSG